MGEEVNPTSIPLAFRADSLAAFDQLYSELLYPSDKRKLQSLGTEETGLDSVRWFLDFVKSEKQKKFLKETLQLYVAGYIFLKASGREVDPLLYEPSKSGSVRDSLSFMTPYLWAGQPLVQDSHKLIDCMFRVWRSRESLAPHRKGHQARNAYRPEYFSCLPALEGPALRENSVQDAIPDMIAQRYGCHFVPHGEMKFTFYCWRLLLCLAQREGSHWNTAFTMSLQADSTVDTSSIWRKGSCEWPDLREADWASFLDSPNEALVSDPGYIVSRFWEAESAISKLANGNCTWAGELCRLGLIDYGHSSRTWTCKNSLVAMAKFVDRKILSSDKCSLVSKPVLSADELNELNVHFLHAACRWLSPSNGEAATVGDLMASLNVKARFPVIPYYYWEVLDSGYSGNVEGRPPKTKVRPGDKSHLVMPVWEQFDGTAVIGSVRTNIAGVAVVGTHPFEELDWTLRFDLGNAGFRTERDDLALDWTAFERIALIREYLEKLSRVPAAIRYLPIKTATSRFAHWAHEVKNYVGPVADLMQRFIGSMEGDSKLAIQASVRRLRILQGVAYVMQSHLNIGDRSAFGNWTKEEVEIVIKYLLAAHDRVKGGDEWRIVVDSHDWKLREQNNDLDTIDERLSNLPENNITFICLFAIFREVIENIRLSHPISRPGTINIAVEVTNIDRDIVAIIKQTQIEKVAFASKGEDLSGMQRVNELFGERGLNVATLHETVLSTKISQQYINSREYTIRLICKGNG